MKWEHKCSLDWLRKRQGYLTASDIKSLLPVTKTGRKREVGDLEYLKVMASKMVVLNEEDCMSYGAMARGHILEPYAIDALNKMLVEMQGEKDHEMFFWWDDKLVTQPNRCIAFSPDAMDVPMSDNPEAPSAIAEVKSYDAAHHLMVAYTPKDQIEERWQIATAMALCPQIDHAYLVLFNPKMKYRKTFVIRFDRSELEDEIAMILEVERNWQEFREAGALSKHSPNGAVFSHHGGSEDSIIAEVEQRQRLNPTGANS